MHYQAILVYDLEPTLLEGLLSNPTRKLTHHHTGRMEFLYFSIELEKRHFYENNLIFKIGYEHQALICSSHQHYMETKGYRMFCSICTCQSSWTLLYCILSMLMSIVNSKTQQHLLYVIPDGGEKRQVCMLVDRYHLIGVPQIVYQEFDEAHDEAQLHPAVF